MQYGGASDAIQPFQGGYPMYSAYRGHLRYPQRGGSFASVFKRFAIPILKRVGASLLPVFTRGAADLISGRNAKDTLKEMGRESANQLLNQGANVSQDLLSSGVEALKNKLQKGRGIKRRRNRTTTSVKRLSKKARTDWL